MKKLKIVAILTILAMIGFKVPPVPAETFVVAPQQAPGSDYTTNFQGTTTKYINDIVDLNGTLWFNEYNVSILWKFNKTSHLLENIDLPADLTPLTMIVAKDYSIWFIDFNYIVTNTTNYIVRFDPITYNITRIPLPLRSQPLSIETHGDYVYVSLMNMDKIIIINIKTFATSELDITCKFCGPTDMAWDKNGNLWIADTLGAEFIMYDNATNSFAYHPLPYGFLSPNYILIDNNNVIWTGTHGGDSVIRYNIDTNTSSIFMTPQTAANEYPVSGINDLGFSSNHDLWFTEHFTNKIGKIDMATGTVHEYIIPQNDPQTLMLSVQGDKVWYGSKYGILSYIDIAKAPTIQIENFTDQVVSTALTNIKVDLHVKYASGINDSVNYQLFGESRRNPFIHAYSAQDSYQIQKGQSQVIPVTIKIDSALAPGTYRFLLGIKTDNFSATKSFEITIQHSVNVWFDFTNATTLRYYAAGLLLIAAAIIFIYSRRKTNNKVAENKS